MIDELRSVMRAVGPELNRAAMRRAVMDDNVLSKASVNAREYSFKKLSTRYFPEKKPGATRLFVRHLATADDIEQEGLLAYVMLLWTDGLMFELGRRWLERRLSIAGYHPTQEEILEQLRYLQRDEARLSTWTSQTCGKIASNYLNTLRDCGLATGRSKKTLRRPHIAPMTIGFAAHLLLGSGTPEHVVTEAELFRLLGLTPIDVIDSLEELDRAGHLIFRVKGDVVIIDFGGGS